jgi:hypothetical protein
LKTLPCNIFIVINIIHFGHEFSNFFLQTCNFWRFRFITILETLTILFSSIGFCLQIRIILTFLTPCLWACFHPPILSLSGMGKVRKFD